VFLRRNHAFKRLKVGSETSTWTYCEEHPVLMVESARLKPSDRSRTTQIMFETFNVPAFCSVAEVGLSALDSDTSAG
jgi:actin-related protein